MVQMCLRYLPVISLHDWTYVELIDEFYLLAQVRANVQRPKGNVAGARRATRGARTAQDTIADARADV